MVLIKYAAVAVAMAQLAIGSPCPFGKMAESGQLSKEEAAKFYKVRRDGVSAVEEMMSEAEIAKRDATHAQQEAFYKTQLEARELPLGGGLLKGALQPFTGELSGIALPKVEPIGLAIVPDKAHPFKYPIKSDVRGMCPTLNTMANHGYISRNGISSFAQAANACQITLGFGFDTCAFLSGLGLLAGGDLPTGLYSIGGADKRVPNTIGPALGISRHGFFEIDQSITRQDAYFGNQANFQLSRFDRWTRIAKKNGGLYDFNTMNQERQVSYLQSLNTNPQFNSNPKALAVALAERVFIPRALPNGTQQSLSNFENIAPFYLNETFPEPNWFRRGSSYDLNDVGADVVTLYAMGPTAVGHNEGKDNFIGTNPSFDLANFTPAEGACFLFSTLLDFAPGQISTTFAQNFELFQAFINGALKPLFSQYKCKVTSYGKPGPNSGVSKPGVSTKCNVLINGKYHC